MFALISFVVKGDEQVMRVKPLVLEELVAHLVLTFVRSVVFIRSVLVGVDNGDFIGLVVVI